MFDLSNIYPDYKSAAAMCGQGYDEPDLAKVVAFKTKNYNAQGEGLLLPEQAVNTIVAVGICAGDLPARPLHVLDFGGGCGFHYLMARRAFNTAMRWVVVETTTMAAQANEFANGEFQAFGTIERAASSLARVDLVHTSGAIQYAPDPMATLDALIALDATYIMLARFPLWTEPSIVLIQSTDLSQNGLGPMPPDIPDRRLRYPSTLLNFKTTMAKFRGYELIASLPSPSGSDDIGGGKMVPAVTVIFRKKKVLANG